MFAIYKSYINNGHTSDNDNFKLKYFLVKDLRRLLTPERVSTDHQAASATQPPLIVDDVLVISLGVTNECPGMIPEHKVCNNISGALI